MQIYILLLATIISTSFVGCKEKDVVNILSEDEVVNNYIHINPDFSCRGCNMENVEIRTYLCSYCEINICGEFYCDTCADRPARICYSCFMKGRKPSYQGRFKYYENIKERD